MTRRGNPATLVPFKPGYDVRRAVGAPSLGRQITAYMNSLGREDEEGNAVVDAKELRAIARDGKAPHAKVMAAKEILRARMDGFDNIGRVSKAADSIDRICDRTEGKPRQTIHVEHESTQGQLELAQTRLQQMLLDPRLPALVELAKREQADESAPVPTEAEVLPAAEDAAPKDIEPLLLSPQDGLPKPPKSMPAVPRGRLYVPPLGDVS